MKKLMLLLAMVLCTIFSFPGCAAVNRALPILTDVIVAVQDAQQILEVIDSAADAWFEQHPDPNMKTKYAKAIDKCRTALDVALRTSRGAKELNQQEVDKAFQDFKVAYVELTSLLQGAGIMGKDNLLKASPHQVRVPEPLALTLKVSE